MKNIAHKLFLLLSGLASLAAGIAIAILLQGVINNLEIQQHFSVDYTNAVWDWKSPSSRDTESLEKIARFLRQRQINTVYLDVSKGAGYTQNTGLSQSNTARSYTDAISTYVSIMGEQGIRVYAAAGDTGWSKPDERRYPTEVLKFVYAYNENYPKQSFQGIEFDIESYNQEGFSSASFTDKGVVLREFLEMVDQLATQHNEYLGTNPKSRLELGFAIPYWYDNENENIRSVEWNRKTQPVAFHLMDRLNALPQTNILIMAYRNAAAGNDGTIAHSRLEIQYAQVKAPKVKVIIGQDVTDVEPRKITFAGQTQVQLSSEARRIYDEFGPTGVFAGIAINDLKGLIELQDN